MDMVVSPHKAYAYLAGRNSYLYYFSLQTHKLEVYTKVTQGTIIAIAHHPHKNLLNVITDLGEVLFLIP
jgi:hypothetical protein